jgi:heme-degrading monooxygenase HmoA
MKYIFEITIKPKSTLEEYVAAWQHGSEIIQKSQGARGTRLYRKIGEPNKLIAIADWESKEARDKAMAGLELNIGIKNHRNYGEINLVGEYEEAEWVALP